jgi:hypothetical protein
MALVLRNYILSQPQPKPWRAARIRAFSWQQPLPGTIRHAHSGTNSRDRTLSDPILTFLANLAKSIAKHGPDGIVAFGMLGTYVWGIKNGFDSLSLYGIVLLIWVGYMALQFMRCRHLERVAETKVKQIEAQGHNLKLRHRRKKAAKG